MRATVESSGDGSNAFPQVFSRSELGESGTSFVIVGGGGRIQLGLTDKHLCWRSYPTWTQYRGVRLADVDRIVFRLPRGFLNPPEMAVVCGGDRCEIVFQTQ